MDTLTPTFSPSLLVQKLVIVGREKEYTVKFEKGLNIIYGDSDTGKSSVLNLIDYLLGGSDVDMYDELEMNGKYVLLQLVLNGELFTVRRDLFSPSAYIYVYPSSIDEIDSVFPREYGPNYNKKGRDGYISDFYLTSLNIPKIKVREAPTREDSPLTRMSFRDIFKYCYLTQDEVGSKNLLSNQYHAVYVKVKETFKFVHLLMDEHVAELNQLISEKQKLRKQRLEKFGNVMAFFRESQLSTKESLYKERNAVATKLTEIEQELTKISASMIADTDAFESQRQVIGTLEVEIQDLVGELYAKQVLMEQNQSLRKDYQQDILKLETSIEVTENMPVLTKTELNCPICEREMDIEQLKSSLGSNSIVALKNELKNLKSRLKALDSLIEEDRTLIGDLNLRINSLREELNSKKKTLDIETQNFISPYVVERDHLVSQKASLMEQVVRFDYLIKLRKELEAVSDEAQSLSEHIKKLNEQLQAVKDSAPSPEVLLQNLSDYLYDYLNIIPIKNLFDVSIDKVNLLPVVRNRMYSKLTSGGLRTIVSLMFLASLLKNSVSTPTFLPRFLMIDTVGKYLGKTKSKYDNETDKTEDLSEGISDPGKYENLYKIFVELCESYQDNVQVILVDNDLPEHLEKGLQKYVRKHFRTDGRAGTDVGLIDDAVYRKR